MMNPLFLRVICLASFALITLSPSATPQAAAPVAEDAAKLKADNDKLRAENQRLRQMFTLERSAPATAPIAPARTPPTPAATGAPTAAETSSLTHWMTSSSSKRHNSGCRWFATTKGRKCSATEGTACLKCGG